jgi:hypothetical protein
MNPIVNSLPLIAGTAEYFEKQTSAAWKLRNFFTNSVVWAAYSLDRMLKDPNVDTERLHRQMVVVATLRVWARDVNTNALALDMLPANVAKTLGLERTVDVHAEASRIARQKCQQVRSAAKFRDYYDNARRQYEEQMNQRRMAVEDVANLCADQGFCINGEFMLPNGVIECFNGHVSDEQLYDDGSVEQKVDQLSETVANALEAMYDECDRQLTSAITTAKVERLSSFMLSIKQMMEIVGVDTKRIVQRREMLKKAMDSQEALIVEDINKVDAAIDAQLAQLDAQAAATPQAPKTMHVIKSPERLAREKAENDAAQARKDEDQQLAAKPKTKRAPRKAKSLKEIGALVQ